MAAKYCTILDEFLHLCMVGSIFGVFTNVKNKHIPFCLSNDIPRFIEKIVHAH